MGRSGASGRAPSSCRAPVPALARPYFGIPYFGRSGVTRSFSERGSRSARMRRMSPGP